MGMTNEELDEHCRTILESRRIKSKVVILCEGDIDEVKGIRSPSIYRKMEQMPDSNFYNECVPDFWRQQRPQFFNCGDRNDVISTYFRLIKLHNNSPSDSYLSPEKLYAIVDLDIQQANLTDYNYHCDKTEDIYRQLYKSHEIMNANIKGHRIFVTGLIHKEAYYLTPELEDNVFKNYHLKIRYDGSPLKLEELYKDMVTSIKDDSDIKKNFNTVEERVKSCSALQCSTIEELGEALQEKVLDKADSTAWEEHIYTLLLIRKAKQSWHELAPSEEHSIDIERFREQLTLQIAKHYSKSAPTGKNHIGAILNHLYESHVS